MAGEGINRILLSFFFFILLMECSYSKTLDKLLQGQPLQDGDELVSALGTFRLGFFSPHASTNRYLGIGYFMPTESTEIYYHSADGYYQKNKPVWVANRATPILDKSGKLVIDSTDGNLKIVHDGGKPITISSIQGRSNTSATLQQSGNLVLDEINSNGSIGRMLWQSFDFPTDTLLPGMKLGINLQTGHEWILQSWINNDSPAPGPFTLSVDPNVTKRLISSRQGGEVYWTSEVWQKDRQHYNLSTEEKWWLSLIFAIGMALVIPLLFYLCCWIWRKLKAKVQSISNRKKLLRELASTISHHTSKFGRRKHKKKKSMCHEFRIFDFQTIEAATNNFSAANKIGEGGFGPVYKGKLPDGQEIAIKRLSRRSRQGVKEFKNEVKLIAKLQHTNLVRLFGCSLHGEERILVYENMPNKSLDFFIFDSGRKKLLNWKKRFNIIEEIAQGLLYLHKYSRLKVIHRDLKANNILLDDKMNPKISDFGMARIFEVDEPEANTNRIVGTYGYMAPEYIMSGIVSTRTDVYSFGVLVLEIISSKKNTCSYNAQRPLNLIGYAWQLWNEDRALELLDSELDGSSSAGEVLRCIQVGLLYVQDQTTDRPTMLDAVSMLTNETRLLPTPKQPAFISTLIQQNQTFLKMSQKNVL